MAADGASWKDHYAYLDHRLASNRGKEDLMRAELDAFTAKNDKEEKENKQHQSWQQSPDGIAATLDSVTAKVKAEADAKAKALALVDGYVAPERPTFRLAGASGRTGLTMAVADFHKKGVATDYDVVVADRLAEVLTGGDADLVDTVTEDEMLDLERAAFMKSVRDERTQARVVHMLQKGKPLRN